MLKKLHGYLGRVAFCFYAAAEKPMVPSFPLIGFHYPKALTPNGSKSDLIFRSFTPSTPAALALQQLRLFVAI
jgi:hypothetical protein